MWSNRKVRFTVIILALVGANIGLWLSSRIFGYTSKDHPNVFAAVIFLDSFFVSDWRSLGF